MKERTKMILSGLTKPILWGIAALFLLALIGLTVIALIFLPGHYKPEHPTDQITGIDILHIPDYGDFNRIDEGEATICRQLDASEYEAFIDALKKLPYQATRKEAIFRPGAAVMIYYADGTSELLSAYCRCYYASPTSRKYTSYLFDPGEFTELLISYGYEPKN